MRRSGFFLPTLRETPAEAQIVSHRLMLRAGLIRQTSAGIYSWLPAGLRVLNKIANIVREEQNRIGCNELLMPTIQSADLWRESGRYDGYGKEMLKFQDRHGRDMLYGPTNEEMITTLFRETAPTSRDLPSLLYHIQWKFRDEIRPRFGVMRGREFYMKDAYSFDRDESSARISYNKMLISYLRLFARMGLKGVPVRADTGPIGGNLSHEFHVLADTGESDVYVDTALLDFDIESAEAKTDAEIKELVDKVTGLYAAADDMHVPKECPIPESQISHRRGIEVGHIFYFGTLYSEKMGLRVAGSGGDTIIPHMGSYGVGVSRLVGALIEAHHDEFGIVWPPSVAPFDAGLISIGGDEAVQSACTEIEAMSAAAGLDILYDERDERPGAKFADMDLLGLPTQIIVGQKALANGGVEVKDRKTGVRQTMPLQAAVEFALQKSRG